MVKERIFILKKLDCPDCAAKIEKKVSGIDGIKSASVDVISKRLALVCENNNSEDLIISVEAAVKSIDPMIEFSALDKSENKNEEENSKSELIRLIAGILIYAVGFTVNILRFPQAAVGIVFAVCIIVSGAEVFVKAVGNLRKGHVFDENFLMAIASIGAFAIGEYAEGAAVLLFYQIGEFFQDLATNKSRKSITDLMDLRPDYANLKKGGNLIKVNPADIKVGELIAVKPYERVPLDGIIIEGHSFVDTSGLTGEPVPREVVAGDNVSSGFVNGSGLLTVNVIKEYGESTVAKIIDLVENSGSKKAKAENFITKFARVYTPIVTAAAFFIAVIPVLFFAQPFSVWFSRAIVFLVVSCPCALVISVPLGFFAGIGAASYNGILVKGGNYLEKLSHVKNMVFDKTGTLTKGVFEVTDIICAKDISRSQLIETAALSQVLSSHPIAKSIFKTAGNNINRQNVIDCSEIAGMGVIAKTTEGVIISGNQKLMQRENIKFTQCDKAGTHVYISKNSKFLGCIIISDIIKDGSKNAVKLLHTLGIEKTIMLTGDRKGAAKNISEKIGIDDYRAELLPADKAVEFEKISQNGITAYVGDGINDAPVLARADVGIAMGGIGSDAAVEAADIVIMDDNPEKIATAMRISRFVRAVVLQNIIFALGIKFLVLIMGALGYANIWAAVFADTGVALLAVINSMRILLRRKNFN